jgi:hypothetical protein
MLEQGRQSAWVTGADEPEPAILGRSEYEVTAPEEVESRGGMPCVERRDVGPDEDHRTGPAGLERTAHSDPEIALPLRDSFDPAATMTGPMACLVGRHRDPQAPAPILCETAQQQRDHRPFETKRCNIADIARKPPLARPELWRPHE